MLSGYINAFDSNAFINFDYMNVCRFALLGFSFLVLSSCEKNTLSKIPQIKLEGFGPEIRTVGKDTTTIYFSLTDGDADLGVGIKAGQYDIFINDKRFDTGFTGYYFPTITNEIKDPKKGLSGTCYFFFTPDLLLPRTDSIHLALGDTTHFELYIVDQAGNKSNHITTGNVYMVY